MFGDIYPMEHTGKTTDRFGKINFWEFWLPQNLLFKAKSYAASRESKIELLMLISDFMVNSMLKNTQRYFC